MGRHPRSQDHNFVEPSSHHHGSHHEPPDHSGDLDDGPSLTNHSPDSHMDSHYQSQSGNHGSQGTSDHADVKRSSDHTTRSGHHGKRSTHQHMNELGPEKHSTKSGHHGKRSLHHHKDDKEALRPKIQQKIPEGYKELREQLFKQAFQPLNQHTGTPYLCSQADINFHQRKVFQKRNLGPFVTCKIATTEILWQNDEKRPVASTERAAIDRLLKIVHSARDGLILGPDLAIKAFSDLDLVFFGGRLRGHVTVEWREDKFFGEKTLKFWGHCQPRPGKGQCHIRLNASMIFQNAGTERLRRNPFEQMIGTLLHEMCHAYEMVRSPRDPEPDDGSLSHGKLFGTRISVVHKRALRILGLWAMESWESHRQNHIFIPYCDESQKDDRGSGEKHNSSGKGSGGERQGSSGKQGGSSTAGGASFRPKRPHKGTDCVIM
ncbi:MAG: hypothetical protein Q9175_003133 [Cornicularia normoerica]